ILFLHALAARSVASRDSCGFIGKEHSMLLVSATGCNSSHGRSTIQLAVNLHLAVAPKGTRGIAQVELPIRAKQAIHLRHSWASSFSPLDWNRHQRCSA